MTNWTNFRSKSRLSQIVSQQVKWNVKCVLRNQPLIKNVIVHAIAMGHRMWFEYSSKENSNLVNNINRFTFFRFICHTWGFDEFPLTSSFTYNRHYYSKRYFRPKRVVLNWNLQLWNYNLHTNLFRATRFDFDETIFFHVKNQFEWFLSKYALIQLIWYVRDSFSSFSIINKICLVLN